MKCVVLPLLCLLSFDGDRERAERLYRDGQYAEAVTAFRAALQSEGESPDLLYNLALACWRAGLLQEAEDAVEKYAASARVARPDLHAGVLGGIRYDEAERLAHAADAAAQGPAAPPAAAGSAAAPADPLPLLEQALGKAQQARDHFVRAATASRGGGEPFRNAERALRRIEELQKRIDELKQQRQQDPQQGKDGQQPKDQPPDDPKEQPPQDQLKDQPKDQPKDQQQQDPSGQPKPEPEGQQGEPKPDEGEAAPEPKPDGQAPEPKAGEPKAGEPKADQSPQGDPQDGEAKEPPKPAADQPEPQQKPSQEPRHDAPGEVQEGKELSPEQTQRLLDELRDLDQKLKAYRARAKSGRRAVERDW